MHQWFTSVYLIGGMTGYKPLHGSMLYKKELVYCVHVLYESSFFYLNKNTKQ